MKQKQVRQDQSAIKEAVDAVLADMQRNCYVKDPNGACPRLCTRHRAHPPLLPADVQGEPMKLPRQKNPVQIRTAASIVIDRACLDDLRRLVEETLDFPAGARITLSNSSPQYIRVHHEETR